MSLRRLGQYEKSLEEFRATQRLAPNDAVTYTNMLGVLVNLNRVKEVRAIAAEASSKNLDSPGIRLTLYQLAFLQSDAAGMADQARLAADRPSDDAVVLYYEADTAAYYGQLNGTERSARSFAAGGGFGGTGRVARKSRWLRSCGRIARSSVRERRGSKT